MIREPNEMCGIAWYLLDGLSPADIALLHEKADAVSHRGPDGTRISLLYDSAQLWAFHRLSIIQLRPESRSWGMQPFVSESTGSTLMCNGEIYNYRSLCLALGKNWEDMGSDCEILLHMMDDDPNRVSDVDGDFAFVYANKDGSSVVAARDRIGVTPLFYGVCDRGFVRAFASEAKALVGAPGVRKVLVFPPGYLMRTDPTGGFALEKYADGSTSSGRLFVPQTPKEASQAIRHILKAAVQKRLDHSDRPVGVLCSGGVDSSIVAHIAASLSEDASRVHAFTMQYSDPGSRSEDGFYARLLCSKMGVTHTVFEFSREDVRKVLPEVAKQCETYDPNTIRAAVPMYLMARKIAETTDIKVILSGEGADEIFQGYNYFRLAPSGDLAQAESRRLVSNLHMFDLLRAERCFSAAGLEIRVPFLDRYVVEFAHSIPGELVGGWAEKKLLRDAFADVECLVDSRVLDRPKERFSDGCGFSYVPQLLEDYCVLREEGGVVAAGLDGKLKVESRVAKERFGKWYPEHEHLIVARTMPEWTRVVAAASGRNCGGLLAA